MRLMRDFNRYEEHVIHHIAHVRYLLTHDLSRTQYISPMLLQTRIADTSFTIPYSRLSPEFLIVHIVFRTNHDVKTRFLLLLVAQASFTMERDRKKAEKGFKHMIQRAECHR